jgi:hypothetical protein
MQYAGYNFRIDYPDLWIRQDNPIDPAVDDTQQLVGRVHFRSQDGKATLEIWTRIFSLVNMPQDASYYAGLDTSNFEARLKNFKIISSGPQTISSIDEIFAPPQGYKVEYAFTDSKAGPMHALRVYIVSNAPYILYVLQFHAVDFNLFHNTFYGMINSFRSLA